MHRGLFLLVVLTCSGLAQVNAPACDAKCAAHTVETQFGPGFSLARGFSLMTGDLDGDGVEDAVIVAQSKAPLAGQAEYSYKAIDPYDSYFGYGNPNITAQFAAQDGDRARLLLIVHSWKADTPKLKFVVLNLPFEQLSLGRALVKKKLITTIHAEESAGMVSALYWDGKKYKWQPQAGGR